jgi:hypothetical protein
MLQLLEEYINKYVAITGKRSSLFKADPFFINLASNLAVALKMTPRQIQEAFRIFGHALYTQDTKNEQTLSQIRCMGTILLCYLRVTKENIYKRIFQGEPALDELNDLLRHQLNHSDITYWIQLYLTGIARNVIPRSTIFTFLQNLGCLTRGQSEIDFLSELTDQWDRIEDSLGTVCQRIESAECLE